MSVSNSGVDFAKSWEKFRPMPYDDSNGYATIGYGSLLAYHGVDATIRATYKHGITKAAATLLFTKDMTTKSTNYIESDVHVQLTQCQFDALADFVFNIGSGSFAKSKALRDINKCKLSAVSKDFSHFITGGAGLATRRHDESNIWSGCIYLNHN